MYKYFGGRHRDDFLLCFGSRDHICILLIVDSVILCSISPYTGGCAWECLSYLISRVRHFFGAGVPKDRPNTRISGPVTPMLGEQWWRRRGVGISGILAMPHGGLLLTYDKLLIGYLHAQGILGGKGGQLLVYVELLVKLSC